MGCRCSCSHFVKSHAPSTISHQAALSLCLTAAYGLILFTGRHHLKQHLRAHARPEARHARRLLQHPPGQMPITWWYACCQVHTISRSATIHANAPMHADLDIKDLSAVTSSQRDDDMVTWTQPACPRWPDYHLACLPCQSVLSASYKMRTLLSRSQAIVPCVPHTTRSCAMARPRRSRSALYQVAEIVWSYLSIRTVAKATSMVRGCEAARSESIQIKEGIWGS